MRISKRTCESPWIRNAEGGIFLTQHRRWFKLDNAGKLYPAVSTYRWNSIFRVCVEFNEPVDPLLLQNAVDRVLPRFPSLKVRMRSGVFWYYLEEVPFPLAVREDAGHPCMPFRRQENHGYLIRVFYYHHRVSAEFFHALTDGTGGLIFIKTLAAEYLRLKGYDVLCDHGALNPSDAPSPAETQDAFLKMPLPRVRASRRESPAWHFPATREFPHTLRLIAASIPCDKLLALSRAAGGSLTEYLTAVILYVAYLEQKKQPPRRALPIRVSVPVNMRILYPAETLRNFSAFVNPGIDPRLGDYTFEEILEDVRLFMRYHVNLKRLSSVIAANVSSEENVLLRLAPLFIKNLAIGYVFRRTGDRLVTSTLTNLGRVDLPTGSAPHIRRLEFELGAPSVPLCNCAAITVGNEFRLVFSSNIRETTLPRETLRFLVERGVPVTVESNFEDD